jgi:hypothetical protein
MIKTTGRPKIMNSDDFEKRLQRQSPREIPPAWRERILTAAESETPPPTSWRFSILHPLCSFLRPHRAAWAGMAGAWLLILAMNLSARDQTTFTATNNLVLSPETMDALKQQRLLFAELIDRPVSREATRSRIDPAGPRSQRRADIAIA